MAWEQPRHDVLLYTVPKSDVPDAVLACPYHFYVGVEDLSGGMRIMRNDGKEADLYAGDQHHSLWLDNHGLWNMSNYKGYVWLNFGLTLRSGEHRPLGGYQLFLSDRTRLLVLTDFRALFNEFTVVNEEKPPIQDDNRNRIGDYYDLVERLRQYAAKQDGFVVDVRRNAYFPDDLNYDSGFSTRDQMGDKIALMLQNKWWLSERDDSYITIVGTDAVVPYLRFPVLSDTANEATFAQPLLGSDPSATLSDMANTQNPGGY